MVMLVMWLMALLVENAPSAIFVTGKPLKVAGISTAMPAGMVPPLTLYAVPPSIRVKANPGVEK